jgi:hypothetical protein
MRVHFVVGDRMTLHESIAVLLAGIAERGIDRRRGALSPDRNFLATHIR